MSLKNIVVNIFLSGKTFTKEEMASSNSFVRYASLNVMVVSGFCLLLAFWIIALKINATFYIALEAVMMLLFVFSFFITRTKIAFIIPVLIITLSYIVFCAGAMINNDAQGTGHLWIYATPLLTILLGGMKVGVTLSVITLVLGTVITLVPGLSSFPYDINTTIRLIVSYILVMGTVIVFEATRFAKERTNQKLIGDLTSQRDEIMELKEKADAASEAKSSFLANMSHEIRTPMNAIIGMTELLLRQNMGPKENENLAVIKQAGTNLLLIINDILDFSKIEAGRLEIMENEYLFASLINDTVNIVRTRIGEKPLRFTTLIDGKLPTKLFGDETRMRQILLNLLTNALKYTHKGNIVFLVRVGKREEGKTETLPEGGTSPEEMVIHFEVQDTGIGIKAEDMGKLFGNFTQFDSKKNQGVEGTGLGLAISKKLCVLMNGDLTAESVYGEGSVFTAELPQKVLDGRPFAPVEDAEKKNCLVYERRKAFAVSITYTLDSLDVPNKLANTTEEFMQELQSGRYQFVFVAWPVVEEFKDRLKETANTVTVVAMAEYGKKIPLGCEELYMPTQPIMVANILNGKSTNFGFQYTEFLNIRFTAPEAHILAVDDIASNIEVVSGLLAPYKMTIDKAYGGFQAVEMAKERHYDLILMDHMMPGMDGLEAAASIQAWKAARNEKSVPIIALTANAVLGMKEMFLAKGFSDYLSKPIEIVKLDEVISRWVPAEKKIKTGKVIKRETLSGETGIVIPGTDTKKGINMTGGTEAGYRKVLAQFHKDTIERLPVFAVPATEPALSAFAIQAHAIKSAAGTIGAAAVSNMAAVLEAAGKAGDIKAVNETLPEFRKHLAELIEGIGTVLEEEPEKNGGGLQSGGEGREAFTALAVALQAALEAMDIRETDRLLEELDKAAADAETRNRITDISGKVLIGEYEEAVEAIAKLLDPKEK
jgi:signal transduction histidine kinase/response regulator of citrate/malate metabolism